MWFCRSIERPVAFSVDDGGRAPVRISFGLTKTFVSPSGFHLCWPRGLRAQTDFVYAGQEVCELKRILFGLTKMFASSNGFRLRWPRSL